MSRANPRRSSQGTNYGSQRRGTNHRSQQQHEEEVDLYQVLELPRNCTEDDVRRAYKKMAVKWHPDKNIENRELAERKFKQVAEAYEVLSDPNKRAIYDRHGMAGLRDGGEDAFSFHSHDPFEIFNQFFGMGSRGRRTRGDPFGFGFGSMFDDDFFGGFGGMGGMASMMSSFGGEGGMMSMSSMSSGGRGGVSTSVSTQTVIKNGKRVTRKVTRTTQPDGTVHEEVEESVDDQPQRLGGGSQYQQQMFLGY